MVNEANAYNFGPIRAPYRGGDEVEVDGDEHHVGQRPQERQQHVRAHEQVVRACKNAE